MVSQTTTTTRNVHIGNVIRNAIVFDAKYQGGNAMNVDSLPETVARLFTLLHERAIDYVLVGGIALLHYVEGRNTEDIDLIMALSSLRQIPEIQWASQDRNFARGTFNDLQIDILFTRNRLFDRVRRNYVTIQHFVERDIPCATVEGLILMKLYALPSLYRQGDFARVGIYENDVATLLYQYQPALEPLLTEVSHHLDKADLAAVREVAQDIQRRIERFGKSFDKSN